MWARVKRVYSGHFPQCFGLPWLVKGLDHCEALYVGRSVLKPSLPSWVWTIKSLGRLPSWSWCSPDQVIRLELESFLILDAPD